MISSIEKESNHFVNERPLTNCSDSMVSPESIIKEIT